MKWVGKCYFYSRRKLQDKLFENEKKNEMKKSKRSRHLTPDLKIQVNIVIPIGGHMPN